MSGKGLRIAEQVSWLEPIWKAHSDARSDDSVDAKMAEIPGY